MAATNNPPGPASAPSSGPTRNGDFTSLFALIIGIDDYKSTPLAGAVADGEAMKHYLMKIGVPGANVQTLFNESATKSNIIEGICGLAANPAIKKDYPILIFYAGHGSEMNAPKGWHAHRSKIQLIVPYAEKDEQDNCRISDRKLSLLLEDLAKEKGDNIVVILDCCHSGSGTRSKDRRVRYMETNEPISHDLISEIGDASGGKRADIPIDSIFAGSASHVLLAACASNQSAMENNGRGVFTQALLRTINVFGIENLTYKSLIKHLPDLPGQQPRCEGKNRDRQWFTTNTIRDGPFYEVKIDEEDYILEAGSLQGVTPRSEFALYQLPDRASTYLGTVIVDHVDELSSVVKLGAKTSESSLPAFAMQIVFETTKALRIHLCDDERLDSLRRRLQEEVKSSPHLYALATAENAKLVIGVDEDRATFRFGESLIKTSGLERIPFRISLKDEDAIMKVVKAASSFTRYLNHRPAIVKTKDQSAQAGKECISIHYTKLKRLGKNKWGEPGEDLNDNHQVDVVNGDTKYGLKITNSTKEDFYPYLFLFNCNDLSITSYYTSPTVKHADQDVPLQQGESITVGYGDGGSAPWRHVIKPATGGAQDKIVRDEENLQVEFFKLFLTTKPVDLSYMEQPSPFQGPRAERDPLDPVEIWRTEILTVVVKKEVSTSQNRVGSGICPY